MWYSQSLWRSTHSCVAVLSRGSSFTTQTAALAVLHVPWSPRDFSTHHWHLFSSVPHSTCYLSPRQAFVTVLRYVLILGGIEHEILCLLRAEIGLIALGGGYPIIFLKTNLREERELIVPLVFVSGKNFTSNKGDEWFGGSCLLKTSVDLPSLQYIPELVPKDCQNNNG